MTNYKKFPYTVINNYVGDVLGRDGIMPKTIKVNGDDQPTIIPGAQIPELNDSGAFGNDRQTPFMVYSIDLESNRSEDWFDTERMNYAVFAPTVGKLMEIIYCLRDLFGRAYASADEVNDWQLASKPGEEYYFEFLTTDWELMEGPLATRDEGGRYGATISITYSFTAPVTTNPNGSVGKRV